MRRLKFILPASVLFLFILYSFSPVKTEEKTVEVAYGTPTRDIALQFYREGLLRNPLSFILIHGVYKDKLEAGEYEFEGLLFPWDIYEKLRKGLKKRYRVTVPEGSDLYDIARLLEENRICSSEDFLRHALSEEVAKKYGLKAVSMEGFLFPDTYYFSKNTHPLRVIDVMHRNFLKKTEKLRERLSEKGLTLEEWVTIASMIEKETSKPEERPLVSAVIHNRLRKGMKLQIDPTVIYALKRRGLWNGRLTLSHLKFEDAYNTYVYFGLPPTPICNPGLESLRASLEPEEVDYLYFVANGKGGHYFSVSYEEHVQYNRLRKR